MGKELRESSLLALSGRRRVFTQFLAHKFAHLSTEMASKECMCLKKTQSGARGQTIGVMFSGQTFKKNPLLG